jgi:alkanesulfonate monooxygenase SsuD/methylene tetrahydromethanopterin reductase-like flavin-dependent oxidoreductase (luciferase family)
VQRPHPPLLIGGNSKRALRRTVEMGDAWHPFIVPKMVTDTARTANIAGDDDIVACMNYMKQHCEKVGRADPPKVICSSTYAIRKGFSAQEALDDYARLKRLGVDASGASIIADSRAEWCDLARQFGEEVIARIDY